MKEKSNYKKVLTEDGSYTYFSNLYGEACHSQSGAIEETKTHYIKGCQIEEKANTLTKTTSLNILEVGFGTGLGHLLTRDVLKDKKCQIKFFSFEIDPELIKIFEEQQKIKFTVEKNIYRYQDNNYELVIILGNARETISDLKELLQTNQIHAIYQDAFSPRRNASLWTVEWFQELKSLAYKDCIMSTYSSSSSIRKSMIKAGWFLEEGVKFGTKRSSTRANLIGPSAQSIIDKLNRSPVFEIDDQNSSEYTLENRGNNEKNKNL